MPRPRTFAQAAARVAGMSWPELRTRGAQEIAKRWDLLRARFGGASGVVLATGTPPRPAFFFAAEDRQRIAELLRRELPEETAGTIAAARRICRHEFDLLGYEGLSFGSPIDWHFDPVHGKRAPRRPWYRIDFLDFDAVGDHKIIWELNRHQHLVTLARASILSGDEAFAREIGTQWYHWREENPYPIGINWASSLEVAFRALSWLWVRHLVPLPDSFERDLLAALAISGRHIERYLSTYFAPNTHLLGEGVALFFLGVLCPELRAAARWRERGWRIVLEQAERQVQADGFHFEHSTHYHVYALDFLLHTRILAARNGIPVPAALDDTLRRMLGILAGMCGSGVAPRFGDDDGGRLFDPRRNLPRHLLDPLAAGALLFDGAEARVPESELTEEAVWLMGPEKAARFRDLPQRESTRSECFPASGIHVMRSDRWQLTIDGGSQGVYGHTHADALSVQLAGDGHAWLIDPGTFRYVGAERERSWFRGTAAHNTLVVDGRSQAEPAGPFRWGPLPEVRSERWVQGRSFDWFVGSHDGYAPVTHRRSVLRASRFWLVRDQALGAGAHQVEVFWHCLAGFHSAVRLLDCGAGWTRHQEMSEWSPVYGRKEPAPLVRFAAAGPLPREIAFVLAPAGEEHELTAAGDGQVHAFRYGPHRIFLAEPTAGWQAGAWSSDALLVWIECAETGELTRIVLCGGSWLDHRGRRLLACPHVVASLEWTPLETVCEAPVTLDAESLRLAIPD